MSNRSGLKTNSTVKLPLVFVLDTSSSMAGDPIMELNESVNNFIDELKHDNFTREIAEVCIVTFGENVNVLQDFESVDSIPYPTFKARGATPMGAAVMRALECLDRRLSLYRNLGIDYYRPFMVLMTDGKPTDSIIRPIKRVQEYIAQRKLVVLPVAIGSKADIKTLTQFKSPNYPVLRLKGLRFRDFFKWLGSSVVRSSKTAKNVEIDMSETKPWAELLL